LLIIAMLLAGMAMMQQAMLGLGGVDRAAQALRALLERPDLHTLFPALQH
jgi:hypothetical protein